MEKLGVFLCTGCGIGDALDIDEVIEAADDHGCACTLTHECFCAAEGLEAIKGAVTENELDGILVAACSDRAKTTEFKALTVDGPSMKDWRGGRGIHQIGLNRAGHGGGLRP